MSRLRPATPTRRTVLQTAGTGSIALLGIATGTATAQTGGLPCGGSDHFEIQFVEAGTGDGIPLVELSNETLDTTYVTDSNGRVALTPDEQGDLGYEAAFSVSSPGYSLSDGTDNPITVQLETWFPWRSKSRHEIELDRDNVAQRRYRVTGRDIYTHTVALGCEPDSDELPIDYPGVNAQVEGQDTVHATVHDGKIFWFYGDTLRTGDRLGNYHGTGARSTLPSNGGLDPDEGVNLRYFTRDDGFVREMVEPPAPTGNIVWIDRVFSVDDSRLIARYNQHQDGGGTENGGNDEDVATDTTRVEKGLIEWREDRGKFEVVAQDVTFPVEHPGQAAPVRGDPYHVFASPLPTVRVPDDDPTNPEGYEYYTCLEQGTTFDDPDWDDDQWILDTVDPEITRNDDDELVWGWRRNTPPITQKRARRLVAANGFLFDENVPWTLYDVETGKPLRAHMASVAYSEARGRYVAIINGNTLPNNSNWTDEEIEAAELEAGLGEIWYAEADSPTGPWSDARRIVTHPEYSFYNPAYHHFFDDEANSRIYFEATYTQFFSETCPNNDVDCADATKLYDYNQILYRLDLEDPAITSLQ